ncbi:MAG: nuclear transport factor 2 family protein, partial [Pseudomonadota bacterium]
GLLLLLVAGSALADHHAAVSPPRQQAIIDACTRTNQDYQFHRDRGNAEAYGALFTEDAEFALQKPLKGRGEITAAMEKRFAERASRHFINVVQLDVTGLDTAEGLIYLMLVGGARGSADARPRGSVDLVAEYRDQYVMDGDRCLIQRRAVEIIFWTQPAG